MSVLWTPAAVPLLMWYDVADAASLTIGTSNRINTWGDKSGNQIHAINTSTACATRVTGAINGLPVARFAGTSGTQRYTLSLRCTSSPTTALVLWNKPTAGGDAWQRFVSFAGASGNDWDNVNSWQVSGNGTSDATAGPQLTSVTRDLLYFNRASFGTMVAGTTALARGDIGEIILTAGGASTKDFARFQGYLAHKWGVTNLLSELHTYKLHAPTLYERAGKVNTGAGAPADIVRWFPWDGIGPCYDAVVQPDGHWSVYVPDDTYGVLYLADGVPPVVHGPYIVLAGGP